MITLFRIVILAVFTALLLPIMLLWLIFNGDSFFDFIDWWLDV